MDENYAKPEQQIPSVVEIIIEGLLTDGAHHKQWCLDQALLLIMGRSAYMDISKQGIEWEKGRAP